jgi:hypothetical protein
MRWTLIGLLLGLGLTAATVTAAPACQYQATLATSDQTSPPQTAQAQPATQDDSN